MTTPGTGKHVLLPGVSCKKGCGQSLEITEGLLSRLQATQQQVKEMGESQKQRAVVQPNDFDRVRIENWPTVSLYLDELPIQKCKFRHQVVTSTFCLEKHSPRGSCHLDESSMNHTLAQKHLIELLMWNASYVQKTLQLNLTGKIG